MRVICAWCKDVIVEGSTEKVSHGICDGCMKKVLAEAEAA